MCKSSNITQFQNIVTYARKTWDIKWPRQKLIKQMENYLPVLTPKSYAVKYKAGGIAQKKNTSTL